MTKHTCTCDRCGYTTDMELVSAWTKDEKLVTTFKLPKDWEQLGPYFSEKQLCDKCSRDLFFIKQNATSEFLRSYKKKD